MDDRLPAVMTEIRSLLELPVGAELPSRADVEDTLTSGCAYALVLEGERIRIERKLKTAIRSSDRPSQDEIGELSRSLARADQELAGVRALLTSLRAQALS